MWSRAAASTSVRFASDPVIYDTLIEKSTPAEIEAVLAHELGHWAHSDPTKLLIVSQLNLVLMLSLFTLFIHNASLFRAFGFATKASPGAIAVEPYLPVIVGLELFQLVLNPTDALLKFGINAIVRRMEYAADRYVALSDLALLRSCHVRRRRRPSARRSA